MRILVVEDEHRIAEAIKKGLMQEGYVVDVAYDGETGADQACGESYDLIILDLMLPKKDGITICREVRSEGIQTPILMLTAKSGVGERVKGLDSGADDYLSKPFAFEELVARVRALLRRPSELIGSQLRVGEVVLDTQNRVVYVKKVEIALSVKEYALLEYLLRNKGKTVSKEQIMNHVWDYDADILPNTVEAYIGRLRSKLGAGVIKTLRGFGYRVG